MKRLLAVLAMTLAMSLPAYAAKRVLVLPFEAPTASPELATLGPGTMDSLITALMRLPDFIVVDRLTTAQLLKEQALQQTGFVDPATAAKLGKITGAEAIITGRVQVVNDQVRISAQFIDVETSRIHKAEQVTGSLDQVFDLQDQLATAFVAASNISPTVEQSRRLSGVFRATTSLQAYDHYQRGREAYLRATGAGYRFALAHFDAAIEADPAYALAYAGKAEALAAWGWLQERSHIDPKPIYDEALAAAKRAISLRDDLPEANRAMAMVLIKLPKQEDAARLAAERAVVLAPNDAEAHLALWYCSKQHPDDPKIKQVLELNPRLIFAHTSRGISLAYRGRLTEALGHAITATRLYPNSDSAHLLLGIVSNMKGDTKGAIQAYQRAIELETEQAAVYNYLGEAYASTGKHDDAISAFQQALRLNPNFFQARQNLFRSLKASRQ